MKRILIAGCALLALAPAHAQQKEGRVTYERTVQMQVNFSSGMSDEIQRMIPRTRTDRFELNFANNQSLWRAAESDNRDDMVPSENGGMQIRTIATGASDIVFSDFGTARRVESRELFDKKFLVDDSIRQGKWKMTGETKTILNHNCMKATSTRIGMKPQTSFVDGKMERKEVIDTTNIIVWFATDIPVAAGPGEFQGQVPGLILEVEVNNGRQTYKAINISDKADLAIIKEPTGKKRYTQAEFQKEREKLLAEMQRNQPGGGNRSGVTIRMQ